MKLEEKCKAVDRCGSFTRAPKFVAAVAIVVALATFAHMGRAAESGKSNATTPIEQASTSDAKQTGHMQNMQGMSKTGDVDYDFAANMRMHHNQAIEMSQAQLKNGNDAEMKAMATSTITSQKEEIGVLDRWMADNKPANAK